MATLTIFPKIALMRILVARITIGKSHTGKAGKWLSVFGFLFVA